MADIRSQLLDHLKKGKEWAKLITPVPGVIVVKVPSTKKRPAMLFLEINPLRPDGRPLKRKGLYIGSQETLLQFSETLNDDKTYQIMREIEQINPKVAPETEKSLKCRNYYFFI